ncbi:MAG: tetratricopeptide repeat protein [Planctomycetes bacterium]|nr:tetratricopeptide repeat protein [Planctomycetota bacterium]
MTKNLFKITGLIIICLVFPLEAVFIFAQASKTIYEKNNDAVVTIITYNKKNKQLAQGSGFIVKNDGIIITNQHVIEEAKTIEVKTTGGKTIEVENVIYEDSENDFAVLKIVAKNLPTVNLGDSDKVTPGENVYVIGSPQGYENSISNGLLSAVRKWKSKKVLQISAPISHGSSGGPVFNENGEVIGIATLTQENAQNVNFAMPINIIKDYIDEIKPGAPDKNAVTKSKYNKQATYWFWQGRALSEERKNEEAIEAYEKAIEIEPEYAEAYNDIGLIHEGNGNYKKAVLSYKTAIRINPDYADAYNNLGLVYGKMGDYEREKEAYMETLRIVPDSAVVNYNIAFTYRKMKDFKSSLKHYEKAVELDPNYADAYNSMGFTYALLDESEKAIGCYKKALTINPDFAVAYYNLGIEYAIKREYEKAIESYKEAIRCLPDYADARYDLALAYLITGEKEKAAEQHKALKKLDESLAEQLQEKLYPDKK